ncbi:unnamed protein product [Cylicostephanus goldi]|uniref:Uncharacterized protein n=1 Tax=Cylicostephanus goldi TaxID=71465 RepID=A0A3P6TDH0_CYLGO|nr:unnamed protein product [Cylicostephanus goldi]
MIQVLHLKTILFSYLPCLFAFNVAWQYRLLYIIFSYIGLSCTGSLHMSHQYTNALH